METKEVVERKVPGSPAGGDVLYFPYKQFSGRFGPNFFTYRVVDHKVLGSNQLCGGKYVAFCVEVLRGRSSWTVARRYSDFDRLRADIVCRADGELQPLIPTLPGKTCFRRLDEDFLDRRSVMLSEFIDDLLVVLSQNCMLQTDIGALVFRFLDISSPKR